MFPKILKPKLLRPEPVTTPQCEADVLLQPSEKWRIERYKKLRPEYDPLKCQRPSSISIDGRCYCRKHAGMIALDLWIEGKLIYEQDELETEETNNE